MIESSFRRQLILTVVVTAVVVALGGGAAYLALAPSGSERIQAALPPLPSLEQAPVILRQKLTEAHQVTATDGTIEALASYASLLHANEFSDAAAMAWQLLIRVDPQDGRWPYYLAHLRRDQGDIDETTRLLHETVSRAPDYAPAWLQLGDMAFKSGQIDQARSCYAKRLARVPGDAYARLGLARIELQDGRRGEARQALLELIEDHPDFASAHNLISRLWREDGDPHQANEHGWLGYRAGRFVAAEDPWIRELDSFCFTPARLFVIGMVEFQTHHGDRGRATYERAVSYDPANPDNHQLLGHYYQQIKEPELARKSLRRSLQLEAERGETPSLPTCLYLAAVERELGNFPHSRAVAKQGMMHHPRSPELSVELGLTHEALDDHLAAELAYRTALSLSPNDTAANFHLGELWLRRDQTEKAVVHFAQSLIHQPTFAPALRYLLQYSLATERFDDAQRYADALLSAYYGEEEVRQLVAICHLRIGRDALTHQRLMQAMELFTTAFRLFPEDVDIAFELGSLKLAQGEVRAALPPLEMLLKARPASARAHLFLAQAYLMDGRPRRAQSLLEKGLQLAEAADQHETAAHIREMLSSRSR